MMGSTPSSWPSAHSGAAASAPGAVLQHVTRSRNAAAARPAQPSTVRGGSSSSSSHSSSTLSGRSRTKSSSSRLPAAAAAAAAAGHLQLQLQHPQQLQQFKQAAARSAAESEARLVQQLVEAGVPAAAAKALLVAADSTPAASPSSSCRGQVLLRLRQLQDVLGLPSIAAAARTMIKQPNLMARRPETLRHNAQQLSSALQLPQHSITRLLCAYPAALDMSPATVALRAAALAQTLRLRQDAAVEVACRCPRLLGLSPQHVQGKLDSLQAELQLPSREAAVEIVVGFPALLGLSSATLACKWRRLQDLAARNMHWKLQLAQLLQQRGAGCLGRVLAAGPGVVDRLQYVLDAQSAQDSSSAQQINTGNGAAAAAAAAETTAARAAVTKPVGELRLTTLLLQSEAKFTARHPEFVLWRLKQHSRPNSSSSNNNNSSSSSTL
ncbi:hypothetical protein COO60DRAFT_651089 [Scenedesmus sp. NREL 46B-D3]|nr:hypothetical protein COO60DRAFT_651089 [Scenedesmus sp. NREL 46B-D3]